MSSDCQKRLGIAKLLIDITPGVSVTSVTNSIVSEIKFLLHNFMLFLCPCYISNIG
jgi:hypothetical protein